MVELDNDKLKFYFNKYNSIFYYVHHHDDHIDIVLVYTIAH